MYRAPRPSLVFAKACCSTKTASLNSRSSRPCITWLKNQRTSCDTTAIRRLLRDLSRRCCDEQSFLQNSLSFAWIPVRRDCVLDQLERESCVGQSGLVFRRLFCFTPGRIIALHLLKYGCLPVKAGSGGVVGAGLGS